MLTSESKKKSSVRTAFGLVMITVTFILSVKMSGRINYYIKSGLSLCFEAIIGSVFPFMIISDIIGEIDIFQKKIIFKTAFEKLFKINGNAISAFVLGIVCGFPIGIKTAANLYRKQYVSRDECERLIAISGNMSPAFIISGIGAALCKSIKAGILLYALSIMSSVFLGIILGIGKSAGDVIMPHNENNFSLTKSIKNASLNTIGICGFILFFSAVCGICREFIKNRFLYVCLLPFLEVSNAAKEISALIFVEQNLKLSLISFSVSFSGLSIFMQTKSFISDLDLSMRPYFFTKLFSGLISALITHFVLNVT